MSDLNKLPDPAQEENKTQLMGNDPDATVLADPDATVLADPDATVLASNTFDPDATVYADPNATVLADAAPTTVAPAAPTVRSTPVNNAPDGIDALDDPYYAPAIPDDLTTAHAPVNISSPVQSLPERKRRLPIWAKLLIAVVLIAAAGAAAWYTYDQEYWGGKTVPDVVGMQQDEAVAALEALGFEVQVETRPADDGFGSVLQCSPSAGVRADPADGATVTVAEARVIPQVVGLSYDEARTALIDAGAVNILLSYQSSSAEAGTVLEVSPSEGENFTSADQVKLTVASALTVPDVTGQTLEDAQASLEASGLSSTVAYVEASGTKRTVVETSPAVGTQIDPGATIELRIVDPSPSDTLSLLEYFDPSPAELASYLADEGFTIKLGEIYASGGHAHAVYEGGSGDLLQISDTPESGRYSAGSTADVLSSGAAVGGVRYAFSAQTLPEGGSEETESGIRAIMEACGFENLMRTYTQDDLASLVESLSGAQKEEAEETEQAEGQEQGAVEQGKAEATPTETRHFICGYGQMDDYTWAVIIGGTDSETRVVALVAPTSHFAGLDLSKYQSNLLKYIAYTDQYASTR